MKGMSVREGLRSRARPAGITESIGVLENGDVNGRESSARLRIAEVEEDVESASVRLREVVVKRRFWEIRYGRNPWARASLWQQGKRTDPNEGSWNSERFMVVALYIRRDGGPSEIQEMSWLL